MREKVSLRPLARKSIPVRQGGPVDLCRGSQGAQTTPHLPRGKEEAEVGKDILCGVVRLDRIGPIKGSRRWEGRLTSRSTSPTKSSVEKELNGP